MLSKVGIAGIKSRCLKVIKCIFSRIVIAYRIVAAHVVSFFFSCILPALRAYQMHNDDTTPYQHWNDVVLKVCFVEGTHYLQ